MSRKVNLFRPQSRCTDADVQAFMAATGITDPTIDRAICNLVAQLKADNLWNKLDAIYPMVGGSATTHKFNLKNPSDTNAAFRLLFSGGWTHDANGATPNGVNAWADTFWKPSTRTNLSNISFGFSSQTQNQVVGQIFGCTNGPAFANMGLAAGAAPNGGWYLVGNHPGIFFSNLATTGFFLIRSTGTTFREVYRNGASLSTNTTTSSATLPGVDFTFGARRYNTTMQFYCTHKMAFGFLGATQLTNADALALSSAEAAFQTTLGRYIP